MSIQPQNKKTKTPLTIQALNTETPRWCAGCGDFGIIMALKKFYIERQLDPATVVNVSGIGCSGRAPNYINTYGMHGIHGRPITIAMGLALARPDLHIFIESGDGDALSIGGNHLIHGINKNFKCVFILFNNEIYALTKNQTSPTTRKDHKTMTQPLGTFLEPLNPVALVLGIGASFVASTADWLPDHFASVLKAAFDHPGFAFIHVLQRCPHFDAENFDHKSTSWFSFLTHPNGIPPDKRITDKAEIITHDPSNIQMAFKYAEDHRRYFGLFYHNPAKPRFDEMMHNQVKTAKAKPRGQILDSFQF